MTLESQLEQSVRRNPWVILATVAMGFLMVVIDVTILNVALPSMSQGLDASMAEIEWVLIGYTLGMTALVPVFGRVSDVFGRKRLFIWGLLFFTLGSFLITQAPTVWWVVAARVVQAVGGALITANTLAIISDTFPPGKRGLAMGIQSILVSGGGALGPTLGGFLVTHFGWESVFYVNLPIGLAGALLAARILPPLQSHRTLEPLDIPGAALLTGGLTTTLLAVTKGPAWGWTSGLVLTLLAVGVGMLVSFVFWEMRVKHPLIDLSLFRNVDFSAGQLAGLFATLSMASITFLLPFYWQGLRGLSPQTTGFLMLPIPLMYMTVSPLSGQLSDRIGSRSITTFALVVVAAALFSLSTITADMPVWSVLWRVGLFGFGIASFMAPNNNAVMSAVGASKRGVAAGLLGTFRFMGQSLGVAFGGTIFAAVLGSYGGVGPEGLPSPETFRALASDPQALEALRTTFITAMRTVFLAAMPLAVLGAVMSALRSKGREALVRAESSAD